MSNAAEATGDDASLKNIFTCRHLKGHNVCITLLNSFYDLFVDQMYVFGPRHSFGQIFNI